MVSPNGSGRRSSVEPVAGAPAAVADCGDERALVVADYHAGIEAGLRYERGVELRSDADARRDRLLTLVDRLDPDRVVVIGDLVHRIGDPGSVERDEIDALLDGLDARATPLTLVPGNHDGGVDDDYGDRIDVAASDGVRRGDVGFLHGHTWPGRELLAATTICVGHEHPRVRLADEVGGGRAERAWLRGRLRADVVAERLDVDRPTGTEAQARTELVVCPAFSDRAGGTLVNVDDQEFLSPFLPDALADAEAYLLDGTRLGAYRRI
jgi:metallophosphoesterase superfamily enzyme